MSRRVRHLGNYNGPATIVSHSGARTVVEVDLMHSCEEHERVHPSGESTWVEGPTNWGGWVTPPPWELGTYVIELPDGRRGEATISGERLTGSGTAPF